VAPGVSEQQLEETWRDTCILLGAPLARGTRERRIKELLVPLEEAMEGKVELDDSGRFYLNSAEGHMEMHLVAESARSTPYRKSSASRTAIWKRGPGDAAHHRGSVDVRLPGRLASGEVR
jgi:hypothetical protein